ncbi:PKD domain-containing protein [Marivirga sp. S37H4]|uniref:PKD domain-containing protein n=1 Tax=Marivirga aurantiaca TaxID=2802615 RepID=A0A935C6C0_9BACT|nr:PKD domain-containing protein [Marivirga aurantiaca]MBK6263652.1 PKD domain-containing protein [Marivirga aurantiaca]
MKTLLSLLIFFFLTCHIIVAQSSQNTDTLRVATFQYDLMGNEISLTPETPPLQPIAGAPKGFYTYYWEFGDGAYSKEEKPVHTYRKKGTYEVKLWATNNYDAGKPPATRPQQVKVKKITNETLESASMTEDFILQKNREPIPNEELVLILSYKNSKNYLTNGKIYLFFNEKKYKANNFELSDMRLHHGENLVTEEAVAAINGINPYGTFLASAQEDLFIAHSLPGDSTEKVNLPLTLEESRARYKDWRILNFDQLMPGEERNIFFTLRATPEMLKDTSAIISVRGIYVPDGKYDNHKVKDMEMEIVTSHDPNKMSTSANFINFRTVRNKKFKYKIKFQNNGEGPANTIRLETEVPTMFNKNTIEVTDMYPECPICPKDEIVSYSCIDTTFTNEKAIFTFKNIYLPGSRQENVQEYDSTKGFVAYNIQLNDKIEKRKTKTKTAIYFDKNEPIITNYATTRFLPGISIGAKVGFMNVSARNDYQEFFFGATISPYKSYRGYLQAELLFSTNSYTESRQYTETTDVDDVFTDSYDYDEFSEFNNTSIYLIPASYRYNLNKFLALGAGMQFRWDLVSRQTIETSGEYTEVIRSENFERRDESRDTFTTDEVRSSFSNLQTGAFIDLSAGLVRIGPSIGMRYVHHFSTPNKQLQFYAIWKF